MVPCGAPHWSSATRLTCSTENQPQSIAAHRRPSLFHRPGPMMRGSRCALMTPTTMAKKYMLPMVNGPAMSTRKSGCSARKPSPPIHDATMIAIEATTNAVRKNRNDRFSDQKPVRRPYPS